MGSRRCPVCCDSACRLSRRDFLGGSVLLAAGSCILGCTSGLHHAASIEPVRPSGPASKYVPTIKAAFVRRKEDYGMWWPGAVYDGRAAQKRFTEQLTDTARSLEVKLDLRSEPIHSIEEADAWVGQAKAAQADGLVVVVLDRQKHSWPTARKAAKSGIATVIYSPVGTSFTTNTISLAEKNGCVVYSAEEFDQTLFGVKMLKAGAKMRRARAIVLKGDKRFDSYMGDLGITLRHIPAGMYMEIYRTVEADDEVLSMAEDYMRRARRMRGATRQDVINGVRGYFTCREILKREQGDAITMDCLGAIGKNNLKESLPCISWSRMLDEGIPAACEADYGAVGAHIITQYLFDRPGFQQDPVADTVNDAVIGAHCTCPTRLNGFDKPSEPFDLVHHHGNRDATARPLWRPGQRVTCLDVLPPGRQSEPDQTATRLLISAGTVINNLDVPPNGGCVVSVRVKFDGDQNVLSFPGFHQLFFYGDYKRQLVEFCKLYDLEAQVV